MVVGAHCNSDHESEERAAVHEDGMRIKAQSRISMSKGGGYGARVHIREDLNGRKHAHAMAVCDCNGQGECYITPLTFFALRTLLQYKV